MTGRIALRPQTVEQVVELGDRAERRAEDLQLADEHPPQVGPRLVAARRAAGDEAAAARERLQRARPDGGADVLDHHVDAAAAGQLGDAPGDVVGGRVDRAIGTERERALQLGVVARGDIDLGTGELGELQRRQRHPAADAEDEHRLPGPQARPGVQHAPGGQVVHAERRRLGVAVALGHRQHVRRRQHDEPGEGAVAVLAEDAHRGAQHVLAAAAELAAAAGQAGMDHHPLAGLQRRLAVVDLLHDARAVEPHDLRQAVRDAGAAVAHVEVDPVQRRCLQPHQHLAAAAPRHRPLADLDHLVAAMTGDAGRPHRESPL